jgi:DNA-binding GntR family transcriptional regulator
MIRREILEGRLAPNYRMREVELSARLGISRTPTRHALSRLEMEGLLILRPRVGLVVSALDDDAVAELYEMRSSLEGTAAALAARHASAREIEELLRLSKLEGDLPADPTVRYNHNENFHQAIYRAAHNRFLVRSIPIIHDAIMLLGKTTMTAGDRYKHAADEHARIVAAIAKQDPDAAEIEAKRHIANALAVRRKMRGEVP